MQKRWWNLIFLPSMAYFMLPILACVRLKSKFATLAVRWMHLSRWKQRAQFQIIADGSSIIYICVLAISFAQLWVFLVLEWQRKQQVPTTSVLPCSRDHVGSSLWHGHWHVERRPVYSVFPQCPAAECSGNSNLQLLSILASIQYFDLSWCNFLTFVLSFSGTTVFELSTGKILFTGKTNNQMVRDSEVASSVNYSIQKRSPEPCLPRWARWSRWSANSLTECGKWVNLPGLVEFFGLI